MDAQAVLPFRDDMQSANNGVLTRQCERRFKYEAQVDAEAAATYGNYPEPANNGILRWESQRKRRFEKSMLDVLRLKCWNGPCQEEGRQPDNCSIHRNMVAVPVFFFVIQTFDQPSRTTKEWTTSQRIIIMSIVISYTMMTVDDQQKKVEMDNWTRIFSQWISVNPADQCKKWISWLWHILLFHLRLYMSSRYLVTLKCSSSTAIPYLLRNGRSGW
ncbi:hypothetical protein M514_24606 [Trichuris suis]|uniref:Uncharacterized protein n=1 Tax=Trichuris suis TaxID=68888 RepID=A0A085N182_9BILA|nr:hypothetical protein M514_24606 [Trichuris suis]